MQRVWCNKCGKENSAGVRWCGACGEVVRPCYLDVQPGPDQPITCSVCGTVNPARTANCRVCGSPLAQSKVGGGEVIGQGGRVSLRPESATPSPPPPAGGSRLSRLAQARREKEAAQGGPRQDSSDWLSGLRSDAPPPVDYATRMDEDDEADSGLSAALREARQQEDAAEGVTPSFGGAAFPAPAAEVSSDRLSFLGETPASPPPANLAPGAPFDFKNNDLPPLPDFASPSSSAVPPRPALPDFDIGAFLAEAEPTPPAADNPEIGQMGDDTSLPDWLQRSSASPAPPASSPTPAPSPAENTGSMPDWLRDLASGPASNAPAEPAVPPPIGGQRDDSGELPDWLQGSTGLSEPSKPFSFLQTTDPGQVKEIPEWLRRTTDDLPVPTSPTFGDVDVEQRLDFAFDESTTDRSKENRSGEGPVKPRHTGLTDLLGLPPLQNADEDLPAFTAPSQPFEPAQSGLPDFLSPAASQGHLPPLPDFLNEKPAPIEGSLAPWLIGMSPPTLESAEEAPAPLSFDMNALPSFDPAEPTPADEPAIPDYSTTLKPWLQGLRPPALNPEEALQSAPPGSLLAPELPDFLTDTDLTAPNPPIEDVASDTRSFSVRDMFRATDDLPAPDFQAEAASPEVEPASFEVADFAFELPQAEVEAEGTDLPPWLSDMHETDVPGPPPPTGLDLSVPLPLPPLPGDVDENEAAEPIPFVIPAFDGPEAPPNPTRLSAVTGEDPADFELPDFLSQPASPSIPKPTATGGLPDFLSELGTANSAPTSSAPNADIPDFLKTDEAAQGAAQPFNFEQEIPTPFSFESLEAAQPSLTSFDADKTDHSLDFLREEAAAQEPDAPAEGEVPSWLQALSSGSAPTIAAKAPQGYSPMATGGPAQNVGELPSWLQGEDAAATTPPDEAATRPSEPFQAIVPPFETVTPLAQPESFVAIPPPSDEAATHPAASAPPTPYSAELDQLFGNLGAGKTGGVSLPAWLNDQAASPAASEPDFMLPETGELPEWLNDSDQKPSLLLDELVAEEAPKPPPPTFESSLDDLGGAAPAFGGSSFLGDVEGPAWLRGNSAQPAPKPSTSPLQPAEPAAGVGPSGNQPSLPSWLRSVAPAATVEETGGPLELPAYDPIALEGMSQELPSVTLPPQLASAAVLSALLAPATTATVVPATRPAARPMVGPFRQDQVLRWGLSVLLLLVALVGLLANPLSAGPVPVTPTVSDYYNQIESLSPNAKVLISYDWEADRVGEMRPLAQTLTAHLMSKRARLFTLSLNPQGPALADEITNAAARQDGNYYQYGQTYLNLGWRTGQEAAVRSLFTNLGNLNDYRTNQAASAYPVMNGVNSLSDFDLVIVLAGDEGGVRTWVEQFGIQPGSRLLFGVPAAVEPLARPYAQALPTADQQPLSNENQVRARGLLAGLNQTAQYTQLLSDKGITPDPKLDIKRRLSAQSLAALVLALVVVVANIVYFLRRRAENRG